MFHKKRHSKKDLMIGAGIGALLAAGAAIFLTTTESGKTTVASVKKHAKELSDNLMDEMSKAKQLSKAKYDKIVDEVVEEYAKKKKLADDTVKGIKKEFKANWKTFQNEVAKNIKQEKKQVKRKTQSK